MCPGVESEWPGKCPVCHMDLVQRTKGEAIILPEGVVARMQFSPYRVQLAGIRTTPVEFRRLEWEAKAHGRVEQNGSGESEMSVDVSEAGFAAVQPGLVADVEIEALSGRPFNARVRDVTRQVDPETRTFRVRFAIYDPRRELRTGLSAVVRVRVPLARIEAIARHEDATWRDRTAVDLSLHSLTVFSRPLPGLESLLDEACSLAFRERGLTLAIPSSSVIDMGDRKIIFVERMAGMYDAVEVTVGNRVGDYYPAIGGVSPGDRVVTSGAFLLDAETRLNPSMAASYFGAGRRSVGHSSPSSAQSPGISDEQLIARQKLCPVTDEELGSMGAPIKVVVDGRPVFICCKGCEKALRSDPKKYLAKIPLKVNSP